MKRSAAARLVVFVVRAYRVLVSPVLGPRCRFEPSCSEYAVMAIEAHGAVKGAALTCRRIARCHPFCPGGVDPVPRIYHRRYRAWERSG